jgi:preprotein translocase subunit Sss1
LGLIGFVVVVLVQGGRVQDAWTMQEQLELFMKKYLRVLLLAMIT